MTLRSKASIITSKFIDSATTSIGKYNNWIIPGLIACGPFPGIDGLNYLDEKEVNENISCLFQCGIDTFVCLQHEITQQDGTVGTIDKKFIWAFPKFCNYSYLIKDPLIKYLYFPIIDQSVPTMTDFITNIDNILNEILKGRKIFIHCAGGHGRTGIYAAALIYLFEKCSLVEALKRTQDRHDSRIELDKRQKSKVCSPSNKLQVEFVEQFTITTKCSFKCEEVDNNIFVCGGMSTEISFAKYCAFRMEKIYSGWEVNIRTIYPDIIIDTLKYVVNTVKNMEVKGCQKPVLYSPGFLSTPYMTELCNMVYLPSQFLVGFNSVQDIKKMLQTLNDSGIKAYAVAGYDACIPNHLVAWIKFIEMPPQYADLICNYLKTDKILLCGVYDVNQKTFGENVIFQYENYTGSIKENDLFFLHIFSCYGEQTFLKDWNVFKTLAPDFDESKMIDKKCSFVGDWESAIDFIDLSYFPSYTGKLYSATALDTLPLYNLSYELSRCFMLNNNITIIGIVANPYIMNNPTYESHYGYLGFTYWAGNPSCGNILKSLVNKDMPENGTLWLNDQHEQRKEFLDMFPGCKKIYINNKNSLGYELSEWIGKYKPVVYPRRNYVSFPQLFEVLQTCGIILVG
jgi:protein-tyrosine phosphatase